MNRIIVGMAVAAVFTAASASAAAPAGHEAVDHGTHGAANAAAVQAVGTVRKVDPAQGKVTLQHEAIPSLGWPAMTMAFKVRDPRLLERLAPGMKVHFAFVQQPGGYVITAIE